MFIQPKSKLRNTDNSGPRVPSSEKFNYQAERNKRRQKDRKFWGEGKAPSKQAPPTSSQTIEKAKSNPAFSYVGTTQPKTIGSGTGLTAGTGTTRKYHLPSGTPVRPGSQTKIVQRARTELDSSSTPISLVDARRKIELSIVQRQGQALFRAELIRAYEGRCAITGCDVADVLEAAHIVPYRGENTSVVQNGILLRADIHTLFDKGLIAIHPVDFTIKIDQRLLKSEYGAIKGKKLDYQTKSLIVL